MIIAFTPMQVASAQHCIIDVTHRAQAMCGFRPLSEIAGFLKDKAPLRAVVGEEGVL